MLPLTGKPVAENVSVSPSESEKFPDTSSRNSEFSMAVCDSISASSTGWSFSAVTVTGIRKGALLSQAVAHRRAHAEVAVEVLDRRDRCRAGQRVVGVGRQYRIEREHESRPASLSGSSMSSADTGIVSVVSSGVLSPGGSTPMNTGASLTGLIVIDTVAVGPLAVRSRGR